MTTIRIEGDGTFRQPVVGESHYQHCFERICGERSEDGVDMEVSAVLVMEDENPYDHNAVAVRLGGDTVGYLDRVIARQYRAAMERKGLSGREAICAARIRGGWDRGDGDSGHYGIQLDIAW